MSKLTLSIDEVVISRAKRYARGQGVSLSRLVEAYLDAVSSPPRVAADTPASEALRGTLKRGSRKDYRRHLIEKYR